MRDGGSRAWSGESGTWHAGWRSPRLKAGAQRTHGHRTTQQPYLLRLFAFPVRISNPVPPEGYRERHVGTGQLLAVSSVISYICPSIGCRCQFRPNRCMAVVSNEKSHLFCWRRKWDSQAIGEGRWGWGNMGTQFSSTQRPGESSGGGLGHRDDPGMDLPSRAHSLGAQGEGQDGGAFRRSRPFASKI